MTLPTCLAQDGSGSHAQWREQPSPAQPSLRRILIVDDDPQVLTALSRLVGCFGRVVSFGPLPPKLVFVEVAFEDEREVAALDAALTPCASAAVVVMSRVAERLHEFDRFSVRRARA